MRKLLREPLLHFALLGVAILVVTHRFVSERTGDEPRGIVVTQDQIESLSVGFARTWQRFPTREERDGLIRDRVREEVYYREALTLGLDRDDAIIRRRLQQKLEFLTDDIAALAEPTDDELIRYLRTHADDFRIERQFTFSHVFLNPAKHGDRLPDDAVQLLSQLRQQAGDADLSVLGDSFLLQHRLVAAPIGEIAKQFGEKFVATLVDIPVGQWHGPVESGYGVHLVLVEERTEARVPELADVREAVHRAWANARRLESNEKFFQGLLRRYAVTVEQPESAQTENEVAQAE